MRDIIFRGKRIDNKEWIEGSAINTQYDVRGDKHTYIGIFIISERYPLMKTIEWYEVIPETVSEFTGLTDKNGTKIFEGDIVKCSDVDDCYYTEEKTEFFGVIKFEAGAFGIATKETLRIALDNWCENDNFVSLWELEWNEYIGNVEIIGNIHDNPELLGGEKSNGF